MKLNFGFLPASCVASNLPTRVSIAETQSVDEAIEIVSVDRAQITSAPAAQLHAQKGTEMPQRVTAGGSACS